MRRRLIAYIGTLRVRRILLLGSLLSLACLLLLVALVASIPTLLSISQLQSLLRLRLSRSLKQPITWSRLELSWSHGMALSGLIVGDGPPPLLNASVGEVNLVPGFGRDASGRFGVNLTLRVKKVAAELAPGPKKPPGKKPVKDPLTRIAEAAQKLQAMDWPLPVDVRVRVDADPMTLHYADPASGRRIVMKNLAFRLVMPSLARLPIETSLTGSVAVGDAKPEQLRLSAKISELVTAKDRVKPASALYSVQAGLPGLNFDAGGGMNRVGGLQANLRLSLPELVPLVAPFAHRRLPTVAGTVALDLRADIDRAGDLRVLLDLGGNGLAVSGIPGKGGSAGPLDIRMRQKMVSNHKRQQVAFTEGDLTSPGLLSASWSATVDRPTARSRSVTAQIGPLRLDLARARRLAGPFLPKNLPLQELKGTAFVGKIAAQLEGPGNDGEVTIEGGGVDLRQLRLRLANGSLHAEGLTLALDRAVIPLEELLPVSVSAHLSWGGKRLELAGKKRVLAQGMKGTLNLALDELEIKDRRPAMMRAVAEVKQTLDCQTVKVGEELALDDIREQLHVKARALGDGELEASMPELKVAVAAVHGNQSGKKVTLRPFAAGFMAEGVHLPPKGKGSPTLQRASCEVSAADALALTAEAGLSGFAKQVASSKGTAKLDLRRLMPMAAPFLPAGFNADGLVAASWDVAAPLPAGPLPKEKNPLRLAKGALALLDRGEFTLKLDDLNLRVPVKQGVYVVKGLRTTPQMRLSIPRAGEPLEIVAALQFAGVSGLPGNAGKLPVQAGTLTVQGELAQWKELRLNEELRLAPLGLSQVAELTVSRIDSLLEDQVIDAATMLKRLDATMFAHLEGTFPREAAPVFPGWQLSGDVSAGARIDLTAARDLRLRGYARCRELGVADGRGMAANGIRADLVVDRSYALAEKRGDDWVPLSAALVRPAPIAPFQAANSDLAARIYEDMRGESNGLRKVCIRSASLGSGPFPLEASALEADLLLEPEVLGLSFFQAELGGGTVRARGVIDLAREVPVLSTSCNFSRLDPALLFPAAGAGRPGEEGELTGEFTFSAPLATEQRALLEGARLNLNLRRFSSRILERVLFAMDPYQRNEKVVAQRKSLRQADLKGLRVSAVDGALDCEGELLVKGVGVDIPKIERLRLSELPIRNELARVAAAITSSRVLLDLVRSDTLVIGKKGGLSLKRRTNAN